MREVQDEIKWWTRDVHLEDLRTWSCNILRASKSQQSEVRSGLIDLDIEK